VAKRTDDDESVIGHCHLCEARTMDESPSQEIQEENAVVYEDKVSIRKTKF